MRWLHSERATLAKLALPATLLACTLGTGALAADGQAVYQQVCVACHQAGAVGAPGLAPSLVGAVSARAGQPAMRQYLALVLTHGLQGRIVSEGQTFNSVMPAQTQLSDEELAAALSHVVRDLAGQAAVPAFTAADLAQARASTVSPKALRAQRDAALAP